MKQNKHKSFSPFFTGLALPRRVPRIATNRRIEFLHFLGNLEPIFDFGELFLVLGSFDKRLQLLLEQTGRFETVASVRVYVQWTFRHWVEQEEDASDYFFFLVDASDCVVGDEVFDGFIFGFLAVLREDVLDDFEAFMGDLKGDFEWFYVLLAFL